VESCHGQTIKIGSILIILDQSDDHFVHNPSLVERFVGEKLVHGFHRLDSGGRCHFHNHNEIAPGFTSTQFQILYSSVLQKAGAISYFPSSGCPAAVDLLNKNCKVIVVATGSRHRGKSVLRASQVEHRKLNLLEFCQIRVVKYFPCAHAETARKNPGFW
jgi:hypothetical protein